MKVLIIDDQQDCIEKITFLLKKYCDGTEIVGEANSGKDGIALIKVSAPDVVFLDVEMEDMTGFEMLERLDSINFRVVFTTSHDKYAIKAIRFAAIDYLLKPVGREDLIAAVERLKNTTLRIEKKQVEALVQHSKSKTSPPERIAFTTSDGLIFKRVEEIVRCESDSNYTIVYLSNKEKLIVSKTLKEIDKTVEGSYFVRVHNSHLVNLNHVSKYVKGDGGYVIMSNGDSVSIARNRKDAFLESFSKF